MPPKTRFTIKLSRPKAYRELKPLRGSAGQPIRCTPSRIVIPEIAERVNCMDCRTKACQSGKCDQSGDKP